ncbi:MAG: TetR/AcrR family transcriptional regulator [Actinomycetota bacterium]|nr:TetR/AcrR family transcriptional regulator [Actinomycetota bacterium]
MNTLVEAAAQMFSREGIATTTNRIAERAGLSIGTLYQYFPDKLALLHLLAQRHVRDADRALTVVFGRLRASDPPFDVAMREILAAVVALHADRPRLHALLHRMAPRSAEELAAVQAFEDRICAEVAYHLQRCGRGAADGRADVEVTARTVVHTVDAQLHRVMTGTSLDVEALVQTVNRIAPPPA